MSSLNTSAHKKRPVKISQGLIQAVWVVMTQWCVPNVPRTQQCHVLTVPSLAQAWDAGALTLVVPIEEKRWVGWPWVRCQETGTLCGVILGRSFHLPLWVSVSPMEN